MATTEILLTRPIGQQPGEISAEMVKRQLGTANGSPIVCRINCDGGSVFEGLAIHDAFAAYPGDKRCVVESSAFSMASAIMMAFPVREITANGFVMIHDPAMVDESSPPIIAKLTRKLADIYAAVTRRPLQAIAAMMNAETFLDAQEALRLGFVTSIAPTNQRAVASFQAMLKRHPGFHACIVARLRTSTATTVKAEWSSKLKAAYEQTRCPMKAASLVDRENPGLRQKLILEANSKGTTRG